MTLRSLKSLDLQTLSRYCRWVREIEISDKVHFLAYREPLVALHSLIPQPCTSLTHLTIAPPNRISYIDTLIFLSPKLRKLKFITTSSEGLVFIMKQLNLRSPNVEILTLDFESNAEAPRDGEEVDSLNRAALEFIPKLQKLKDLFISWPLDIRALSCIGGLKNLQRASIEPHINICQKEAVSGKGRQKLKAAPFLSTL